MFDEKELTPFSAKCLIILLKHFPEFEPYVIPSEYDDHHWSAELPWPDKWEDHGLRVQTRGSLYGEDFRVDIGNQWHEHFSDYAKTGSFEFLQDAFSIISEFVNEKLVSVYYWYKPNLRYNKIKEAGFVPTDVDWGKDILTIQTRSWKGTHQEKWERPTYLNKT